MSRISQAADARQVAAVMCNLALMRGGR